MCYRIMEVEQKKKQDIRRGMYPAPASTPAVRNAVSPLQAGLLAAQAGLGNRYVQRMVARLKAGQDARDAEQPKQPNPIVAHREERENHTGLPDQLKFGIEQLSGYSLDDVRVHYNSPKPAELQALAYTQGAEIHVAPGQERHLPHEAWHVVQQAQGRVHATMQMKDGIQVNDDQLLEYEADLILTKAALKMGGRNNSKLDPSSKTSTTIGKQIVSDEDGLERQAEVMGAKAVLKPRICHETRSLPWSIYSPSLRNRTNAPIQRMASSVLTDGGLFKAMQYEAYETKEKRDHVGAGIALLFNPFPPAEGRVGLIQTIREKTTNEFRVDAPVKMKAKAKGKDEEWRDHIVGQSPVYGGLRSAKEGPMAAPVTLANTQDPKTVMSEWETPAHQDESESEEAMREKASKGYESPPGKKSKVITGLTQTGKIHTSKSGVEVVPAGLVDQPGFAADSKAAIKKWEWSAEVAAVILDGVMMGTYLGSVKWGWTYEPSSDGSPVSAVLDPVMITLVKALQPSREFRRAGKVWNETPTPSDSEGEYSMIPVPYTDEPSKDWVISEKSLDDVLKYADQFVQHYLAKRDDIKLNVSFQAMVLRDQLDKKIEEKEKDLNAGPRGGPTFETDKAELEEMKRKVSSLHKLLKDVIEEAYPSGTEIHVAPGQEPMTNLK